MRPLQCLAAGLACGALHEQAPEGKAGDALVANAPPALSSATSQPEHATADGGRQSGRGGAAGQPDKARSLSSRADSTAAATQATRAEMARLLGDGRGAADPDDARASKRSGRASGVREMEAQAGAAYPMMMPGWTDTGLLAGLQPSLSAGPPSDGEASNSFVSNGYRNSHSHVDGVLAGDLRRLRVGPAQTHQGTPQPRPPPSSTGSTAVKGAGKGSVAWGGLEWARLTAAAVARLRTLYGVDAEDSEGEGNEGEGDQADEEPADGASSHC